MHGCLWLKGMYSLCIAANLWHVHLNPTIHVCEKEKSIAFIFKLGA